MANPRSRSRLRALAPLALVAFVIAVVLVVAGSKSGGSQNAPTKATDTSTSQSRTAPKKKTTTTTKRKPPATTYTVKTGDNLGSIAEKTRVPVDKLRELNPDLDPQALVTGQKIKLKG